MSRFLVDKYSAIRPYTPGEQPREMKYIKLNTNESPFPPSPGVLAAVREQCGKLQLYSDPECTELSQRLAQAYGLEPEQLIVTNGSDETLNFAFMAFADEKRPLIFPDISYGFYRVLAELNAIPYREPPLREDFSIDPADYLEKGKTAVIANPNAPTGMCMSLEDIAAIAASDRDSLVIVDEAYVDFGGESALCLLREYDNLLVVRTFSKSRSMAGARIGFAMGAPELIRDLNAIKYSVNPYNVNRMSAAAGCAALAEDDYYMDNCRRIAQTREETAERLRQLGFEPLPSMANFIFCRSDRIGGGELYSRLKARGILVRHFDKPRIRDYIRVTIGTQAQMAAFLSACVSILEEI